MINELSIVNSVSAGKEKRFNYISKPYLHQCIGLNCRLDTLVKETLSRGFLSFGVKFKLNAFPRTHIILLKRPEKEVK